jgi:FxsC-like protein
MAFQFFLSYAHVDAQRGEVKSFFDKLTGFVAELLPRDEGQVGFIDQQIAPALEWGPTILGGLRTARSMVCLLSEQYLDSDYSGRELAAFKRRVDELGYGGAGLILPVLWTPMARQLPNVLSALQTHDAELPQSYRDKGLAYLSRLRKYEDDVIEVIYRLAQLIAARTKASVLPESTMIPPLRHMPNLLRPDRPVGDLGPLGPKNPKFVFIAAHPNDLPPQRADRAAYGGEGGYWWCPYNPPESRAVGALVNEVVLQANLRYGELPAEAPNLLNDIELAAQNNTPVAIVIDPWSLTVNWCSQLVHDIVAMATTTPAVSESCGLFVSWNDDDPDTQREALLLNRQFEAIFNFQAGRPPKYFYPRVDSMGGFRRLLDETIKNITLRAMDAMTQRPPSAPAGGAAPTLSTVEGSGAP